MPVAERRAGRDLSRSACFALLAPGGGGRVAAAMRAVPVIIPVRFRVIDEQIVFRPDGIDGVERALTESVVAFEADHVDPDGRITWDVHVTGVATRFAEEDGPLAFRLSSEIVSGWRSEP